MVSMSRYPIRRRFFWAALISGLGTALLQLGFDQEIVRAQQDLLTVILNVAVAIGWLHASEKDVTPSSDPRDSEGRQLVPVEDDLNPI